ncbi:MAG: hypothetical protein ACOCTG_05840 [Bacteroidota bacterium]
MARKQWTLVDRDVDVDEMKDSTREESRRYRWFIPDVTERDLPELLGKENYEGVEGDVVHGRSGVLGRLTSGGLEVGEPAVDILRTRGEAIRDADNPTGGQLSA